jgi:hypothetical protein
MSKVGHHLGFKSFLIITTLIQLCKTQLSCVVLQGPLIRSVLNLIYIYDITREESKVAQDL